MLGCASGHGGARGSVMDDPQATIRRISENVERVILGKSAEVRRAVLALASDGHLLVEDVPGTGKTMLARALAVSTGCSFSRIQFTPICCRRT